MSSQESTFQQSKELRAYLALLGGVLLIGFAPIFTKLAETTGDVIGFFRLMGAALVLSVPVAVRWRQGGVKLPKKGLILGVLAGLAFATDIGVWSQALHYTTASTATFLGNTAPIWVGLGAWLIFREQLGWLFWVGLSVALGGALLLIGLDGFGGSLAATGNLMSMGVGVAYAAYQLLTSRGRKYVDNLTFLWLFTLAGGLSLGLVSLLLGSPVTGLSTQTYLALLALVLLTHIGGWLLINYAFGHLRASLVSVSLLGQPIVATLFAAPILGEVPSLLHVVGGLITVSGIYLVHRSANGQ